MGCLWGLCLAAYLIHILRVEATPSFNMQPMSFPPPLA